MPSYTKTSPDCPGTHNSKHDKKHHSGKCPGPTKRGNAPYHDICSYQFPTTTGAAAGLSAGWAETKTDAYHCYLGPKPSAAQEKKYKKKYRVNITTPCPPTGKIPNMPNMPKGGNGGAAGASVVPATTASDKCAALLPFGSKQGAQTLLDDIKYFQTQELNTLKSLQKANTVPGSENTISNLVKNLKVFQDSRIKLMQQLNNVSTQTQCSLASDRTALQDQITMTLLAEDQLKMIERETEELINERNNKHRMVEITNYEYERYSSHKNIFKIIANCCLFVLAGVAIGASGNSTFSFLGYPIVVISIAVAIFLTIKSIWWNYWRSERNWNQFQWDMPDVKDKKYETVWQHDKRAFEKAWEDTKYEAKRGEKWGEKQYKKGKDDVEKAFKKGQGFVKSTTGRLKQFSSNLTTGGGKNKDFESFATFR